MEPICKNCDFWKQGDLKGFGECRRFPPKAGELNRFPTTSEAIWCAEFVEKGDAYEQVPA